MQFRVRRASALAPRPFSARVRDGNADRYVFVVFGHASVRYAGRGRAVGYQGQPRGVLLSSAHERRVHLVQYRHARLYVPAARRLSQRSPDPLAVVLVRGLLRSEQLQRELAERYYRERERHRTTDFHFARRLRRHAR